jgi:hypothetical protein
MNIFHLDHSPTLAAQYLCDKHISKMLIESAQMLCTTARTLYNLDSSKFYKSTHKNHPMTLWVGAHPSNFRFTMEIGRQIAVEYTYRYKKIHKTQSVIDHLFAMMQKGDFDDAPFNKNDITTPPQCMPEEYQGLDYIIAYRKYYQKDKKKLAVWNKDRPAPYWWIKN